jgi:uncharacterized membrane protein
MSQYLPVLYGLALLPYAAFFGIAVYLFIAPCYTKLSGRSFIEFFQKIDPFMKVRAPLLALAQIALTLLLLAFLVHPWRGLPFCLTLGALLSAVISMTIAIKGNAPLNRKMDRWSPADPPPSWEQVRDQWLRLHALRGVMGVAGFVLLLAATLSDISERHTRFEPTVSTVPTTTGAPPARCLEATVFLPLADNRGQYFADTTWDVALEILVTPFGGATLGESQEGCWLDARGRVCRERIRPVAISFAPERLGEFRRAVHAVGRHLGQEAMYVRFEEPRVELIPTAEDGSK